MVFETGNTKLAVAQVLCKALLINIRKSALDSRRSLIKNVNKCADKLF